MRAQGFTLTELLAAVAIVGVLATIALPRYRSMVARSRQAEATTNLGTISELQKSYYYDGERGYYHGGMHYGIDKCAKSASEAHNELGFRLADCSKSRYRYITNSGNDCAKSDGSVEQGQVYPGCNSNDVWHISTTGQLTNPHDVVRQCPLGVSSASATCNPGSLPSPPAAPLSSSSLPRTPSPPPSPPAPPTVYVAPPSSGSPSGSPPVSSPTDSTPHCEHKGQQIYNVHNCPARYAPPSGCDCAAFSYSDWQSSPVSERCSGVGDYGHGHSGHYKSFSRPTCYEEDYSDGTFRACSGWEVKQTSCTPSSDGTSATWDSP